MERLLGLSDYGILPLIGCAIIVYLIIAAFKGGNGKGGNKGGGNTEA